jgi:MFS family permease
MQDISKNSGAHRGGIEYKWIALSNTTLSIMLAFINTTSVLLALPVIFRGIGINPLAPGSSNYLLWLLMGYMLVTAVFVVAFGRLGDMFGRTRMYNLGFATFTLGSLLCALTWSQGSAGAIELILFRVVQGIGGAFLFANSPAILTDAFPENQRGMALGLNQVAGIGGSFLGILVGGLLSQATGVGYFCLMSPSVYWQQFGHTGRCAKSAPDRRSPSIGWETLRLPPA